MVGGHLHQKAVIGILADGLTEIAHANGQSTRKNAA